MTTDVPAHLLWASYLWVTTYWTDGLGQRRDVQRHQFWPTDWQGEEQLLEQVERFVRLRTSNKIVQVTVEGVTSRDYEAVAWFTGIRWSDGHFSWGVAQ